jgi:hypothetical protein
MRKYIILALGIFLMTPSIYSQTVQTWTEDFDGNVTFTAIPSGSWVADAVYSFPGSTATNPKSYLGLVPTDPGDSTILQTPIYDCTTYEFALLKFDHICKISPSDIVRVEYRVNMGTLMGSWSPLPLNSYKGRSSLYVYSGKFNSETYPEWQTDSTVFPSQMWWKEEVFDLYMLASYSYIQFRFVIQHGSIQGSQLSYGWLLDNVQLLTAPSQIYLPKVEFVAPFVKDIAYGTGPWEINAKVEAGAVGVQIQTSWLKYTAIQNGTIVGSDSVLMTQTGDNSLWKAIIEQFEAGTEVVYSITGKDMLGNTATAVSGYVIQKGEIKEIVIGTGTSTATHSPYLVDYDRSWSRAIYYDWEFNTQGTGGLITGIAYNNRNVNSSTIDGLSFYVKVTQDNGITNNTYINPVTDGATLVWGESTYTTNQGWNVFTFHSAFYLPPGYNLMIYCLNDDGSYSDNGSNPSWSSTRQTVNNEIYAREDGAPLSSMTRCQIGTNRPDIKAFVVGTQLSDNSIALTAINSPIQGQTTGNVSAPITVTIRNKGDSTLTSATIYRSINGVISSYPWTGSLPWDFEQQISLGTYQPRMEGYDTVLIWVSMPNGLPDNVLSDDTLFVITYGCSPSGISSSYIIGQTGDFQTIREAISMLKFCSPLNGNITFEFESGIYNENIDLTNLSRILGRYSLTLTSVTHDANDVIIKPVSGAGITLSQSNNIIIKDITIDVTTGTNAIHFTGVSSNVVIRDCRLLANQTTTSNSNNLIYNNTGELDSIFILHNFIDGGYSGMYLYGTSDNINTNLMIDSNIVQNNYDNSIYLYYSKCISISCNTILSRTTSGTNWYGIYTNYTHVDNIIGNRIRQRSNTITRPYGIYFYYQQNASSTDTALIANNEIILYTTGTYYGMYVGYGRAKILYNSIYVEGTGAARGIHIQNATTNYFVIKNNNIIMEASTAYPIYLSAITNLSLYDMDYNNMYAPQYVGYAGGNKTSISDWQSTITTDKHSVNIRSEFIDSTLHLQMTDYTNLECPKVPLVRFDIEHRFRAEGATTMGCYHGITPYTVNAALIELSGNKGGSLLGTSDNITTTLLNAGTTTFTKVTIKWTWNNVSQPDVVWTGTLSPENTIDVSLGAINYTSAGDYIIKAWIDSIDLLTDECVADDTASITGNICPGPLNGTYLFGAISADFQTLTDFTNRIAFCGIGGDIVLEMPPRTYPSINLTDISKALKGHTLTLTSATHNANDVIVSGIVLSNSNNIIIKDITVGGITQGGNGIDFTGPCTNVVIRDCRLLKDTINDRGKPITNNNGGYGLDSIFILHNFIDGGNTGIEILGYSPTGSEYLNGSSINNTNIIVDSNIVQNSHSWGIVMGNESRGKGSRISHNIILNKPTTVNIGYRSGIRIAYGHVENIIGNRIILWGGTGIFLHEQYGPPDTVLIANNEIIIHREGIGIETSFSYAKIMHNSIYIGDGYGINIEIDPPGYCIVNNNNIVMSSQYAYPIAVHQVIDPLFRAPFYARDVSRCSIDYNNLYAPNYVGYVGGPVPTLEMWKQIFISDTHSVRILSEFVDTSSNLNLKNYNGLFCPSISPVNDDINNVPRGNSTVMGAYTMPVSGQDVMLTQVYPGSKEVVNNEEVQVSVDLLNTGTTTVTGVTLGWSVNGALQAPATWTANSQLNLFEQGNISIGNFTAINADTFYISVWVESINGQQKTIKDTISTTVIKVPLAEFIAPFVKDTVYSLSFDVYANIRTQTGAPAQSPKLQLTTIVNGYSILYDSIPMIKKDSIWQANIPQQYYGSKLIYSLTVSDTTGNTLTIMDSTYIKHWNEINKIDSVIIGITTIQQGGGVRTTDPWYLMSMYNGYSWSRQIYLYKEICSNFSTIGTYISKIAWQSYNITTTYTNQSCYMRAIDDSVQVEGYYTSYYIDPLRNGASHVWTGTLNITPGWLEITLDTPFFLPADKNLEIFWNHQHGTSLYSTRMGWASTSTQSIMTIIAGNDQSFPITFPGNLYNYRPNIKITKKDVFSSYTGNNLTLLSFTSPVNSFNDMCEVDHLPATVVMRNLGDSNYDFSKDTVTLYLEVIDPHQGKYTASIRIDTGILASGMVDTFILTSALPIMYAGRYDMKAWVESPVDYVVYDDTVFYSYTSGRIGLPIDEGFSGNVLPFQFVSTAIIDTSVWEPYNDQTSTVQPVVDPGMIKYVGAQGSMAQLTSRQLDLNGAISPILDFWYYHDSTASSLDKSYTDVRIVVDGIPITVLKLFRKDVPHGWKQYIVDLSPYTNGQCVLIEFKSMNKFGSQSAQYIDRIFITSTPDLAVSNIVISPEISACSMGNKELKVVVNTTMNQAISFHDSASLAVDVPGYSPFNVPLQGMIAGNSSDTVLIASNLHIPTGINTIRAYLTSPVDNYPLNDTAYYVVNIQPALSVSINPVTTVNSRINVGVKVWQEVVIENTGNVELSGIELVLRITGTNQEFVRERVPVDLAAGETYTHQFVNFYIVPEDERYQVSLIAYLACDSANVNAGNAIDEYVDMHNLSVISINNPPIGQPDTVGAAINITVSIANTDDVNSFRNMSIYAVIETEEGQTQTRLGTIEEILPLDTLQFTFRESYTVPEDSVYRIRVYLARVDNYPEDDTTETIRRTVQRDVSIKGIDGANVFTLGQNIPNPANNRTRIDYSIPEAGEVVFHIHSVSGQLLYSRTIETANGKQSLELNTSSFAAGIYFYSIEYKGQRLIKRLMISD